MLLLSAKCVEDIFATFWVFFVCISFGLTLFGAELLFLSLTWRPRGGQRVFFDFFIRPDTKSRGLLNSC
jgi:hypothetical protein